MGYNFYCSIFCQGKSFRRRSEFICENTKCRKKFEKLRKEIGPHNYCSTSCAAIVNNQKFPKWRPKLKLCKVCEKQFRGGNKYCSIPCYKQSRVRHEPDDLLKQIKFVYKKFGRVPARREVPNIDGACRYAFGTWNNAIVAAGLTPNRSHENRMYKRTITKAKDGHFCDSISEALIDNWLEERNIKHEKNVKYPNSGHVADWKVGNFFVEYFGLAKDSPRYDRNVKIKQKLCKRSGIKLIEIYPTDLYPKLNLSAKLRSFF